MLPLMLAVEDAAVLPCVVAVLVTVALIVSGLAHLAHASNHKALSEDLDLAHEALDVGAQFARELARGKSPLEALNAVSADPEAIDLWKQATNFVAHFGEPKPPAGGGGGGSNGAVLVRVGALLLAVGLAFAGCTSAQLATAESDLHRATASAQVVVQAYRDHQATVDEVVAAAAALAPKTGAAHAAAIDAVTAAELLHANPGGVDALDQALARVAAASAPATASR